jgi:CrcB protein
MSITFFLAVAGGGLVGAPSRYLLDRAVNGRFESDLPWGTFIINVTGAFFLGLLTGLTLAHRFPPLAKALLGTGFCGAYTTFSTFSFETVSLIEDGRLFEATMNVFASVSLGLVGAAAGVALGLAM